MQSIEWPQAKGGSKRQAEAINPVQGLTSHECLSSPAQVVGPVGVQLGVGPPQLSLMVEGG